MGEGRESPPPPDLAVGEGREPVTAGGASTARSDVCEREERRGGERENELRDRERGCAVRLRVRGVRER